MGALQDIEDVLYTAKREQFFEIWKPKINMLQTFVTEAPEGLQHTISVLQSCLMTVETLKREMGSALGDPDHRPCNRCLVDVPLKEYCGLNGLYLCPDCFNDLRCSE